MKHRNLSEGTETTVLEKDVIAGQSQTEKEATPQITVIEEPNAEILRSRLVTIMRSPRLFLASLAAASLIGYAIGALQFQSKTNVSNSYQTSGNPARLSNQQLRARALDLSNEIRKFILESGVQEHQMAQALMAQTSSATSTQEKQALWESYSTASASALEVLNLDFKNRFQKDAAQMRSILKQRLGHSEENAKLLNSSIKSPAELRKVMEELGVLAEEFWEP